LCHLYHRLGIDDNGKRGKVSHLVNVPCRAAEQRSARELGNVPKIIRAKERENVVINILGLHSIDRVIKSNKESNYYFYPLSTLLYVKRGCCASHPFEANKKATCRYKENPPAPRKLSP
jgi:hypothetical protein